MGFHVYGLKAHQHVIYGPFNQARGLGPGKTTPQWIQGAMSHKGSAKNHFNTFTGLLRPFLVHSIWSDFFCIVTIYSCYEKSLYDQAIFN